MEDELEENTGNPEEPINPFEGKSIDDKIVPVSGLYESWFLDYASYVILESHLGLYA